MKNIVFLKLVILSLIFFLLSCSTGTLIKKESNTINKDKVSNITIGTSMKLGVNKTK